MMKALISLFETWLLIVCLTVACNSSYKQDEIKPVIKHTKAHFVPDSRVERFDVHEKTRTDSLILVGETTLPHAKSALLDSFSSRNIAVVDSITVLPVADLNGKTYALANNSVINIRSKPGHAAQLATQALLGMPLKILKQHNGWYLVQTPEDYISWVNGGGIERIDQFRYEQWKKAPKLIYQTTYGFSYEKHTPSSGHVTDLVAGDILKLESSRDGFYKVSYPDGRIAYVAQDEAKPFGEWKRNLDITQASLVKVAKTMMGVPYLWGGTSTKGIDCSGFTKTIYFMNGMIIPRDASQQVRAGKQIDTQKDFDRLQPGDLLFFGHPATGNRPRRVSHVGMWIGDNQFIHSAGRVHISSVDSTAPNFDPGNVSRYLEARRYLDHWQGNIIPAAAMYKLEKQNPESTNK